MDDLFETLCELFDDELERQENILLLCRKQGRAVRDNDTEALLEGTEALQNLTQEAADAEAQRRRLLEQVAGGYELPSDQQNLSGLIAVTPEPWKTRMRESQRRLRDVLREIEQAVQDNAQLLSASLEVVNNAIGAFEGAVKAIPDDTYTERGTTSAGNGLDEIPALIDQKG